MISRLARRRFVLAAALALPAAAALAQTPSSTPLSIVVPYPAGGVSDVIARIVATPLGKALGRTVVVENISGASGSIAASKVLNAPANGNLLFMGSPTETVLAPLTLKAVKYKPADFTMLGLVNEAPLALYVRNELPLANVDELATRWKGQAGKELSYGSTGPGSLYHLAGDSLRQQAGIAAVHVPYRGGAPLLQDIMAGTVDAMVMPVDGVIGKLVEGGKIRAVAVAAPRRSPRLPNVPTFAESRTLPRFTAPQVWVGLMLPTATPAAITAEMHKALGEVLAQPEVRQALEAAGGTLPAAILTLPQAKAYYQAESERLGALATAAKLEPS